MKLILHQTKIDVFKTANKFLDDRFPNLWVRHELLDFYTNILFFNNLVDPYILYREIYLNCNKFLNKSFILTKSMLYSTPSLTTSGNTINSILTKYDLYFTFWYKLHPIYSKYSKRILIQSCVQFIHASATDKIENEITTQM